MKPSEKEFVAEAFEIIEDAGGLLLQIQDTLGSGVNPDTVNALFRSMHTLKGTSGLFGYQEVTDLSHALENLLDDIRLGRAEMTGEVIEFMFGYMDILKGLIQHSGEKRPDAPVMAGYLNEIKDFVSSLKKEETEGLDGVIDQHILDVLSEYEEHRLKANVKDGKGIYIVKTILPIADFDKPLEAISEKLRGIGELISTMPTSAGNIPPDHIGFDLMVGTSKDAEDLGRMLKLEVATLHAPKPSVIARPQTAEPVATVKTDTTTVRVDIEKLDAILNSIGELSLARDAVKRIWQEMVELYGHGPLVVDLYRITQAFERRLMELQDQVLAVRMVPVGQIFGRLSQIVRRYSREAGKKINLAVFGEDTELDKYLAEEIIDPLVQIIKNAIDHGIEPFAERMQIGKTESGTITLKAFQRGNHVVIEVGDDGRGIDAVRIREKALEKGIIEPDAVVGEKDLLELIFVPGFSTKESVSEVSGRGVGLDIVKEKIASFGGLVEVVSESGSGTLFTLTLPITLAIIKALIVRVGKEQFAVPLSSISETLVIEHSELQSVENKKIANMRGYMLPVVALNDVFNLERDVTDRSFAVVVSLGGRRIVLLVDELMGQHEVVIKPVGDYFEGVKGFAGAAEVGKHEVILVLDVESVIEEITRKGIVYV